jgi:hypothetical protein
MRNRFLTALLLSCLALTCAAPARAQDESGGDEPNASSQQAEESDEAYRRRMELEDARARDRTYADTTYSQRAELEKIDKLPEESRENIRDQLVDIIVENGEWEPSDALEDYPYEPTETAKADPELLKQEQEAWDEQIEKYHQREAEAFGSYRGPVPGPGNPDGAEGGQDGADGQDGGAGGSGAAGGNAGQQGSGAGAPGSYQPYASSAAEGEEAVSTAGVSQSALDFLRGAQGAGQSEAARQAQSQQAQSPQAQTQQAQTQQAQTQQTQSDSAADESEATPSQVEIDMRGIIAIEDLDKLEGAASTPPDESGRP